MKKLFFLLLIIMIYTGCETFSDDSFLESLPDTYAGLMASGWEAFTQSDFTAAIEYFRTAADRDAKKPEPYLGLGWSYARSYQLDLESAVSNFQKAQNFAMFDQSMENILLDESNAGLAIVNYAQGNYQDAIDHAETVLSLTPDFSMRYDSSVNDESLLEMQQFCHFYLQHISLLYEQAVAAGYSFETVETITGNAFVTVLDSTALYGIHQATVENSAHRLITVSTGTETSEITIRSIDEGANTFKFWSNPIYNDDDIIVIIYAYTQNYGSFMDELLEHLSMQ